MTDYNKDNDGDGEQNEQPFMTHLFELRDKLLRIVVAILLVFVSLIYFANDIYHFVSTPLIERLPQGSTMIATDVTATFFTPIKLTFFTSFFVTMPYVLYQIWSFVAPALYQREKRFAIPLFVTSVLLFYTGVAFAHYLVAPLAFGWLTSVAPEGVAVMPDIQSYLGLVLKLFFAFGLAFEIPVAVVLAIRAGIAEPESLIAKRPYIIVGCFTIAMLLTPPDIISQFLLAIPMWLLFEIGVIWGKMVTPPQEEM